eukprot:1160033-Pelagomonas_calceolata.AAC.4
MAGTHFWLWHIAAVQEIKGTKNLNISWKVLTEIMCRKLPDYAKFVLVTGRSEVVIPLAFPSQLRHPSLETKSSAVRHPSVVGKAQARLVVEKCIENLQTESLTFLRDPKPDRINVSPGFGKGVACVLHGARCHSAVTQER